MIAVDQNQKAQAMTRMVQNLLMFRPAIARLLVTQGNKENHVMFRQTFSKSKK